MNSFQLRTRIHHFFHARHYRGHGIHSPFMYSLIREVGMRYGGRHLIEQLVIRYGRDRVLVVDSVHEIAQLTKTCACSSSCPYCVILREPFLSAVEHAMWHDFWRDHHCVAAHFQGALVVFFDPKLQKQYYCLR